MSGKRWSLAAATLLAAALLGVINAHPAAAQVSASVTVNATAGLGTVPAHAIGLSTAVYDST